MIRRPRKSTLFPCTTLSRSREYVELPAGLTAEELDDALTNLGLEVESIVDQAATVKGDLVVGRVLTIEELTGFKKPRSEEHTSELQSRQYLVCRLLLEKKKQ